jgi:pyrimidine-specific ribonucleoside hydrolase
VRVDTSAGPARGQTIVDRRTWAGDLDADPHQVPATVVDVALQVDSGRYAALWLSVFG